MVRYSTGHTLPSQSVGRCRQGEKSREELDEMRKQLKALQGEVGQLTSTLDMILGGFGPRRPTKEAKKSVLAAMKESAKDYVAEK